MVEQVHELLSIKLFKKTKKAAAAVSAKEAEAGTGAAEAATEAATEAADNAGICVGSSVCLYVDAGSGMELTNRNRGITSW